MTDNEIIKALECCSNSNTVENYCTGCPYETIVYYCASAISKDALDLINRLKAENKILSLNADTAFQDGLNEAQDLYAEQIKNEIKSVARKEFAERVKQTICENTSPDFNREGKPVNVWNAKDGYRAIDNLLEEMG